MRVYNDNHNYVLYNYTYKNNDTKANKDSKNLSSNKDNSIIVSISNKGKNILREAKEVVNELKNKNVFVNISNDEIRELPEEYRIRDYSKLPFCAKAIDGGRSPFEDNTENQWEVFSTYLKKNGINEEKVNIIQKKLKNITSPLDQLNSLDGYRGYSVESFSYIQASEVALRHLNNTLVTDELKEGFNNLISEYKHFNTESRRLIMEEMTPDYMVIGLGKETKYRYKDEIIARKRSFYANEQSYFSAKFSNYYKDDINKNKIIEDLTKHLGNYYGSRYQYEKDNNGMNQTIHTIENIMSILNYS